MMTCIILHNMIVEDERDEYEAEPFDPNDNLTDPRRAEIYERPEKKIVLHMWSATHNNFSNSCDVLGMLDAQWWIQVSKAI